MKALTRTPREVPRKEVPRSRVRRRQPAVFIVGITGDGYVPVVEDYETAACRYVVGLPRVVLDAATRREPNAMREQVQIF